MAPREPELLAGALVSRALNMDRFILAAWVLAGVAAFSIYRHHVRADREQQRWHFGGFVGRVGFLLLGLTYALHIENSWPDAPVYALVLVILGMMLEGALRTVRWLDRRRSAAP